MKITTSLLFFHRRLILLEGLKLNSPQSSQYPMLLLPSQHPPITRIGSLPQTRRRRIPIVRRQQRTHVRVSRESVSPIAILPPLPEPIPTDLVHRQHGILPLAVVDADVDADILQAEDEVAITGEVGDFNLTNATRIRTSRIFGRARPRRTKCALDHDALIHTHC